MRNLQLLIVGLALVAPIAAQPFFSAAFNQNPVPVGVSVQLQLSSPQFIVLSNGCGYVSIRAGSPTGPIVQTPAVCTTALLLIGPTLSQAVEWDGRDSAGATVAPGTYYVEVGGLTIAGLTVSGFFPVRIDPASGPLEPVLTASVVGSPLPRLFGQLGGRFDLQLSSPADPFTPCIAAASFSTDVGQSLPPFFIGLDADLVFALSFPSPLPGIFQNFQPTLDATGSASMAIVLPPGVLPSGTPLAVQAVVFGAFGTVLSNVASLQVL